MTTEKEKQEAFEIKEADRAEKTRLLNQAKADAEQAKINAEAKAKLNAESAEIIAK